MRLDKLLAELGYGSRSEIKKQIKKGRIRVNGQIAQGPDLKIDTENDRVEADGRPVAYAAVEYFMLNKPAGYVSATEDKKEPTVLDLITDRIRDDLFPVGRLDKDTEGLLLITNDGALAHSLLSPRKHVDKVYFARVRGLVTQTEAQQFLQGLDIGDEKLTLPAELKILRAAGETVAAQEEPAAEKNLAAPKEQSAGNRPVAVPEEPAAETPAEAGAAPVSEVLVTLREGRYHQVKRMFQAVGMEVLYLKRLSMGPLKLDETLPPGGSRRLTPEEIKALKACQKP